MKRKIKFKKAKKDFNKITIVFIIIIMTFLMLKCYVKKSSPRVLRIINDKVENINITYANNIIDDDILNDIEIEKIIIVTKNAKDEITQVDFNIKNSYQILRKIVKKINNNLEKSRINSKIDDFGEDYFSIKIPFGIVFNSPYIQNFGPKIPLKVNSEGVVNSGLKTKVKDYGLNNVLMEIYATFEIRQQIIIPFNSKNINKKYEVLIASKIIEGKVPGIYGGNLSKEIFY